MGVIVLKGNTLPFVDNLFQGVAMKRCLSNIEMRGLMQAADRRQQFWLVFQHLWQGMQAA